MVEINWNKYAKSYDLMCLNLPEYQELIEETTSLFPLFISKKIPQILEIGSGTGNITINTAKKLPNAKITSIEYNTHFVNYQKEKISKENLEKRINIILADVRDTKIFQKKNYDAAIIFHVLNFFPKDEREIIVQNIYNVLKSKGHLIICDIGRKIPVENWTNEIISNLVKNIGVKNAFNIYEKIKPAITANIQARERQDKGISYMHSIEDLQIFLENFGFKTLYKKNTFYRGLDDFIICQKNI